MISTRRIATTLVAACLATGLAAAPAATAADGGGTKATAAQKKKAKGPTTRKLNTDLRKVRTRTTKAERSIRSLDKTLKSLRTLATGTEGKANTLLTAAPQLIAGLTQAGNGLKALQTALEGTVAPALKALETGLKVDVPKAITAVATSQEYGVIGIFAGPTRLPITLTSSDIPDDGNSGAASGEIPIVTGPDATAGQLPGGTPLNIRAAIRSGETDGAATGDPAGYVGGLLTLKCGNVTGCDLDGAGVQPAVPAGSVVCTVGPPPTQEITLPNGQVGGFPIVTIQEKSGRTELAAPGATSVNPLVGAAATGTGNSGAGSCTLGARAGDVYLVQVQAQFFDLPTSLTPGPTD